MDPTIRQYVPTPNTMLCKNQIVQLPFPQFYNSANVFPTTSAPQIACSCGWLKSFLVQFLSPVSPIKFPFDDFSFSRIANLSPTSVTVTAIEMTIKTMIIQVIKLIFVSAILSLKISASSRNTLQRSLRTLILGVISRYSRMAKYRGWRVGSESQKKLGTSRMLDANYD